MGMPIRLEIVGEEVGDAPFERVFAFLHDVDAQFSPFKRDSEVSRLNRGEVTRETCSDALRSILSLCDQTKLDTDGYFDIVTPEGKINPSGLVKGWAIQRAAEMLIRDGWENFFVEAGGDIQVRGKSDESTPWRVGIRNPFKHDEVVQVLSLSHEGIATSGTYERGEHIYDPHAPGKSLSEIVSLTVIGPNVYEADRFATAAFAMGKEGIAFIARLPGFEGYMIDRNGIGTQTPGFIRYTLDHALVD